MKPGKRRKYPPFVALDREMLRGDPWRSLNMATKVLYVHLKSKYVGTNNGEINLHYSELKGLMAPATASRSFKELIASGWIEKTKIGGLYRFQNHYKLTGKYDKALVNYSL